MLNMLYLNMSKAIQYHTNSSYNFFTPSISENIVSYICRKCIITFSSSCLVVNIHSPLHEKNSFECSFSNIEIQLKTVEGICMYIGIYLEIQKHFIILGAAVVFGGLGGYFLDGYLPEK